MPQNSVNFEGRRGGTRHNTCKANGLVRGQVPGTASVNGAAADDGCPATATRVGESAPAGILDGAKPQSMVNGFINHGYKGKSTKAAPPRTRRKQRISAGWVSSRDISGGISVTGAASLAAAAASPSNSDQMSPAKKFRRKKRDAEVCQENSTLLLMPPHKEEDWENEVQEVTLPDWEKRCFGDKPYGPEDVLHFAFRDLTLKQRDTIDLSVTANYRPAARHPRPVRWFCYNTPTEPDQFADADE